MLSTKHVGLAVALVTAVVMLGGIASAQTNDTSVDTATASGELPYIVEMTVGDAIFDKFVISEDGSGNSKTATFSLKANAAWNVTVVETGASTDGLMNTSDGAFKLGSVLKADGTGLTSGSAVEFRYNAAKTGDTANTTEITYTQPITYSDDPNSSYSISLEYTAYCLGI